MELNNNAPLFVTVLHGSRARRAEMELKSMMIAVRVSSGEVVFRDLLAQDTDVKRWVYDSMKEHFRYGGELEDVEWAIEEARLLMAEYLLSESANHIKH